MKKSSYNLLLASVIFTIILISCTPDKQSFTPIESYIEVDGGRIWYRITGQADKTPILLLHGGLGFPSYYLNPLGELGKDRPVIFFDQAGCGRSEIKMDTSKMTVDFFVKNLEHVRSELGLEAFYLYGHSWGTMLATDYYLKHPEHVKGLVLASPALSAKLWAKDAKKLIGSLPDSLQTAILENEEKGSYDDPKYQEALNVFYQRHVARKLPWDANIDSTFTGANMEIYHYMWGPSEFTATGTLINYDRTDRLSEIKVPTLYICGEFDEAIPSTVQYYQSLTPGSEFVQIDQAAHLTMHDNPVQDLMAIKKFLEKLEP